MRTASFLGSFLVALLLSGTVLADGPRYAGTFAPGSRFTAFRIEVGPSSQATLVLVADGQKACRYRLSFFQEKLREKLPKVTFRGERIACAAHDAPTVLGGLKLRHQTNLGAIRLVRGKADALNLRVQAVGTHPPLE